ncbi:MAG: Tfp pilus assembly protein FimT/FimU [Chlamydiales bacterium]
MKRVNSFTLFELLLVMSLVALVLGVGGLQIPRLLSHERFEAGVAKIEKMVELSSEIMLDCKADVTLVLRQEEEGVVCQIEVTSSLPKRWNRFLRCGPIASIQGVSFDDTPSRELLLSFDASLGSIPKGCLTLHGKKRSSRLFLSGYPGKMGKNEEVKDVRTPLYPQEVFSLT